MPLTASKTETWTMAATRLMTSGEVAGATIAAWSMILFQSVTSSARTAVGRPTAKAASTKQDPMIFFMTSFLLFAPGAAALPPLSLLR